MNEDDTFRILQRPTFKEMNEARYVWIHTSSDHRPWATVLKDNGWTSDEFAKEANTYGIF